MEIKHKLTGAILWSGKMLIGADLRYANLRYANLRHADLYCAGLRHAGLRHADLYCADLSYANLSYANLRHANLRGADLRHANLRGVIDVISLGDPNGWSAFAWHNKATVMVQVGCKGFTLAEGRAYWADKDDRREVMAALDYAEAVAKLRDWK